jgi:hypothetical protein
MLEIFIMIGVVLWFSRTAKAKGQSGALWGFLGAISYYGPVLLFGWVIYPALVQGYVTQQNHGSVVIIGLVLNIAIGISCCLLARYILLHLVKSEATGPINQ